MTPLSRQRRMLGSFADRLPPRKPTLAVLTEAISELNRLPWTATDEQMAFELERILERRGYVITCRMGVDRG